MVSNMISGEMVHWVEPMGHERDERGSWLMAQVCHTRESGWHTCSSNRADFHFLALSKKFPGSTRPLASYQHQSLSGLGAVELRLIWVLWSKSVF